MRFALITTAFLLFLSRQCSGDRILALYPAFFRSHLIAVENILENLAERGHEVTLISPFRFRNRKDNMNLKKEIVIEGAENYFKDNGLGEVFSIHSSNIEDVPNTIYATAEIVNYTMNHPRVQELLRDETVEFDLLIMDQFLNDAFLGFAHLYQIPTILTSSSASNKWTNKYGANPNNPAFNPHIFLGYTGQMDFWQRLVNSVFSIFEDLSYNLLYLPAQESMYQRFFSKPCLKRFGPSHQIPSLVDIIQNVSLVLVSSNPVFHDTRAFVPSMIEIGGLHINEPNQLPKDMMHYFGIADDGIICFSFGSTKTSEALTKEKLAAFNYVLVRKPTVGIMMKWEERTMEGQADNVVIGPVLPQLDILAHNNTRLFITNGGLLSIYEAIYTSTPILGIPMAQDQYQNVALVEQHKIGRFLDINNITIESVKEAVEDVMQNPIYKENIEKLSRRMFKENPDTGRFNRTMAYIEFVLKTKEAPFRRSTAGELNVWQLYLIDVALVLILIVLIILAVPSVIIGIILRRNNNKLTKMDQKKGALKAAATLKKNK